MDDITDSMDMSLFNMNNMFVQHPGHSEGQGGLVCCSVWDHKELDLATEQQQKLDTKVIMTKNSYNQ